MCSRVYLIFLALTQTTIAAKISGPATNASRKSLGNRIITLLGSLRQTEDTNTKTMTNSERPLSNLTDAVINFVNTSYECGSEEAKIVIPKIIRLVKGIFKMPFVDFFVNETMQAQILEKLEECAKEKTFKEQRKRKASRKDKRYREREKESRSFFTGAIVDDSDELGKKDKKQRRPSKAMTIRFRSILDDIIDAGKKSKEESRETLMRILSEIDDYLRENRKKKYEDSGNLDNESSSADSNKGHISASSGKEYRADNKHGTNSKDSSEELVFDHNMEISVRMNPSDTK